MPTMELPNETVYSQRMYDVVIRGRGAWIQPRLLLVVKPEQRTHYTFSPSSIHVQFLGDVLSAAKIDLYETGTTVLACSIRRLNI